jgi:GAF domain-containing protein
MRCQRANVRLYEFADEQKEHGLILHHSYGYFPEEAERWLFLSLKKPGIVTKAFHEGKPVQVTDVQKHPDYVQYLDLAHKFNIHAMACFPLIAEGNRLGTVSLYRNRREDFSHEEMNLGEALANNLAAAICNQKLVENIATEMSLRQKGLNTLSRISRQLVAYDDIYSLTQVLADLICQELDAEVSAVFLLEGDHLYRHAISGVEPGWFVGESYKVGQGITGKVAIGNGRYICENNVGRCQDVIPEYVTLYSEHLNSGTVKHLLAVPLHGQHGILGIIRVLNKLNGNSQSQTTGFTQQDIDLMQTIACIAAVAMENVRRLTEQRFLMDVGWAVTSNPMCNF